MSETTTVHAADIFTADQVREVDYNALEIAESLGDDVTCLEWSGNRKLVKNYVLRPWCNTPASLHNNRDPKDGK